MRTDINPLLMESRRKYVGLYVLSAILSLVLPGLIMYLVPSFFHGVLAIGIVVTTIAYSAKMGLGSVAIIYLALVTVTWEVIRYTVKKLMR